MAQVDIISIVITVGLPKLYYRNNCVIAYMKAKFKFCSLGICLLRLYYIIFKHGFRVNDSLLTPGSFRLLFQDWFRTKFWAETVLVDY